jgi:hypothetical protein
MYKNIHLDDDSHWYVPLLQLLGRLHVALHLGLANTCFPRLPETRPPILKLRPER